MECPEHSSQGTECVAMEDDGEEDSSEQRARRPMNAFLLFCKRHRSVVRQEHPRLDNRGATKILADWWAVLEPREKQKYTDMAKEVRQTTRGSLTISIIRSDTVFKLFGSVCCTAIDVPLTQAVSFNFIAVQFVKVELKFSLSSHYQMFKHVLIELF